MSKVASSAPGGKPGGAILGRARNGPGADVPAPPSLKTAPTGPEIQHDSGTPEPAGFQNSPGLFEREDWTLFRSLATLPQKAGVPLGELPPLVCKELADNALDAAGRCRVGLLDDENGFFVEDDGPGIPGTDAEVARLFSIGRPLASSKLIRLPTRGALGNGLRVVAGAVLASRGSLTVTTGGRALRLTPRDGGWTDHERVGDAPPTGTRVEVRLGEPFRVGPDDLCLAQHAIGIADAGGPRYAGKTAPHWYDADAFWELCQAAGVRTVRELIAEFFHGCSEPAAGKIASVVTRGRLARDLSRAEAAEVLSAAKERAKPVRAEKLGCAGPSAFRFMLAHTKFCGTWRVAPGVEVPVNIEVWADPVEGDGDAAYLVCVNRTPVAADTRAYVIKDGNSKTLVLHGCSARIGVKTGRRAFSVAVNVDTPFMPITSDGKTPDLRRLAGNISDLAEKAGRKLRCFREPKRPSQKDLIIAAIPGGAAMMSDNGALRFSQRQLFYAVRDTVKRQMPAGEDGKPFELDWNYFCQVITDHEADRGDIPGMTRDPRGTLYHPHTREEIPLGTLAVESYQRPRWTFNKILYCEKEGFTAVLRDIGWPERNDCALVSSKGYASRAVRDVFDLLGETDEEITFFCIHDADAYGTTIYDALQNATKARPARKVAVINLGLELAEALAMGLEPEPVEGGDKAKPVGRYVEDEWRERLQTARVELNAMTTRRFIEWLDAKFAPYAGKLIPPADVLAVRLTEQTEAALRRTITARVLAEARVEERISRALSGLTGTLDDAVATITDDVALSLDADPQAHWSAPVGRIAARIAARIAEGGVE